MKLVSAVVGVVILLYFSIKHHHHDLFDNKGETPGINKESDDHIREH